MENAAHFMMLSILMMGFFGGGLVAIWGNRRHLANKSNGYALMAFGSCLLIGFLIMSAIVIKNIMATP